jgi:hypothetical protein
LNQFLFKFTNSPQNTAVTNSEIAKYNLAARTAFDRLSKKFGGFSFWNGPRDFMKSETEHHPDGLHFTWPTTIQKVDMVIVLRGFIFKVTNFK